MINANFHSGNCPICNSKMNYSVVSSVDTYICSYGCWEEFSDNTTCNLYKIFNKQFAFWFNKGDKDAIQTEIKEIENEIKKYYNEDSLTLLLGNIISSDSIEINRKTQKLKAMGAIY